MASRNHSLIALVFVLGFFLTVPWLSTKYFATRGEPREALVIQSMYETGNWILPRGYGDVVPSKPPFMHWLATMVSYEEGGVSEESSRLPSALCALIFLVFFFGFLEARTSTSQALLATALLATSVEWFRASLTCRVDMTLAALLAGALLSLYLWWERKCDGVPLLAILLFTFATLTKGPVSLALPGAIWCAFLLVKRTPILKIIWTSGVVFIPAFMLASLWYLAAFSQGGSEFSARVFYENVARFTSSMEDEPHKHGVFYLFGTVLLGLMPWTLLLIPSLIASFGFRGMGLDSERVRQPSYARNVSLFSLITVIGFIVFYSIPSSKRSVYLLPAYPFLAILSANFLSSMNKNLRSFALKVSAVLASVLVFLYVLVTLISLRILDISIFIKNASSLADAEYYVTQFAALFSFSSLINVILLLLPLGFAGHILYSWWREKNLDQVTTQFFCLCYSLLLVGNAVILPALSNGLSPKQFASELKGQIPENESLYSWKTEFYGLSFYLKQNIFKFEQAAQANQLIVLEDEDRESLKEKIGKDFEIQTVARSTYGITKPDTTVSLVRLIAAPVVEDLSPKVIPAAEETPKPEQPLAETEVVTNTPN